MSPHLALSATSPGALVRPPAAPGGAGVPDRSAAVTRRRIAGVTLSLAVVASGFVGADRADAAPVSGSLIAAAAHFQSTAVVNVADNFTRSVKTGLGAAARGGRYTTQNPQSRYSVRSGRATIAKLDPRATRGFALRSVTTAQQRLRVEFSLPKLPRTGNGTTVVVALRTGTNGAEYRAQVRVTTSGRLRLSLARVQRGKINVFGSSEVAAPGSAKGGRHVFVDGLVLGTSKVDLAVRAWVRGARMPGWQLSRTDARPGALSRLGHVGVYFYRSATSGSGRAMIHSLAGWTGGRATPGKPTRPVTPPTSMPSTSTPPTATPPSDTPPSSTPPTSAYHTTDGAAPGAAPLGTARYAIPAGAIFVSPSGSDTTGDGTLQRPYAKLSRAVTAAQTGSTIVLRGGDYNEYNFVKKAVTIQNYPGEVVWLDGSIPVTDWRKSGNVWVHDNWGFEFDNSASFSKGSNAGGFIDPKYPLAANPDQVFLDDQPQVQVSANPAAGQFAVDYAADTITVGSNPLGHAAKASNLQQALVIGPGNVTVRGIGVRNYATSLWQMGTVYIGGKDGHTTLQNVVVANNATEGIALYSHDLLLDHVTSTGNGMTGIEVSQSNDSVVQNTVIEANNREHFNPAPATAGIKIHRSDNFTVQNSVVARNNQAAGIWTDINVTHFYFVGNNIVDNGDRGVGILVELSSNGIVADNRVSGSNAGFTAMDSANVKVLNNTFANNKLWDIGTYQDDRYVPGKSTQPSWIVPTPDNPWVVQNINFSNNDMSSSTAVFQLHPMDYYTNRSADDMALTVDGNLFRSGNTRMIGWGRNDNKTTTNYGTVAAFQSAKNAAWRNVETRATSTTFAAADVTSYAVPLPADVASAMGAATGTKKVGATW